MSANVSILPVGNLSGIDPASMGEWSLAKTRDVTVGVNLAFALGTGIGAYFLFKKQHPVWGTLLALSTVGNLGVAAAVAFNGKLNTEINNAQGAMLWSSGNHTGLPPGPPPTKTTGPVAWEA